MDASMLTQMRQNRSVYQGKISQQNSTRLNTSKIPDYTLFQGAAEGSQTITPEDYNKIIGKKKEYTTSTENLTYFCVLILGDGRNGLLTDPLLDLHKKISRTTSPFKKMLITNQLLTNTYTGANLYQFDVVIFYTKDGLMQTLDPSQTYNTIFSGGRVAYNKSLGINLTNYVKKGGHLIMASYSWGKELAIPRFKYNLYSAFLYSGFPIFLPNETIVHNEPEHPILKDRSTTLFTRDPEAPLLSFDKVNQNIYISPGSKILASYTDGTPFLVVKTEGKSRIVGINCYIAFPYSGYQARPELINYVYNCILWCVNMI